MDILIVYDRADRATRRTAELLAGAASAKDADVMVKTVATATPEDVASAGALIPGCGVRVRFPFGGERTHEMAGWIGRLPPLEGKPVGVFCTYAFFPVLFADAVTRTAETLHEMGGALEARGATVVASQAFRRGADPERTVPLVQTVLEELNGLKA